MLDQLKARLLQALKRFAARKAENQAQGMALEAQGIVANVKSLASRNPAGFAALLALSVGILWLMSRKRD